MYLAKSFFLFITLIFPLVLFSQERSVEPLSGLLKKGVSGDTIREYYENGALKTLCYTYKKKYKYKGDTYYCCLYVLYDENGNQVRRMDDMIGYDQIFAMNGDVISYQIYNRKKSKSKYFIEYFPGGTKKTVISKGNRYDFDENERLRRQWVRKNIRRDKKFGTMIATIYFEEYSVKGDISKSGRFYTNLYNNDPWLQLAPEFPADIDSVPLQDFKEIVYPQLGLKEVYRWNLAENKTIVSQFEQKGDSWSKIRRRTFQRKKMNSYEP